MVHYLLDGLTLCGDLRARNWTENPDLPSCPACRLLLAQVGAYHRRAEPVPDEPPERRQAPMARVRLR